MRVRSVSREEVWASAGVQGAWVPLTGAQKVPRCDPSGKQRKSSFVFEKTVLNLIQAAKNQDPRGFRAGWKGRLPSVLHSDWRGHLPVPAEEDASPEPSAASEDQPTAIEAETSDRDLDSGFPASPPTVEIYANKSRSERGTVPRNEQGGKSTPVVSASASTLPLGDVASSSDAPARPATTPRTVSADAALQVNLVLIVGRGETTMREKVDPRRAQVAQVGEGE